MASVPVISDGILKIVADRCAHSTAATPTGIATFERAAHADQPLMVSKDGRERAVLLRSSKSALSTAQAMADACKELAFVTKDSMVCIATPPVQIPAITMATA